MVPSLARKSAPVVADATQIRPVARPATAAVPPPPKNARTVEQFDTTTAEARKEAAIVSVASQEIALGDTIASLGDPTRPGFWLETPLVKTAGPGRVMFPDSGKSAKVDLIPIDAESSAGSRISLAAMRLIEAPLTGLPKIEVFSTP